MYNASVIHVQGVKQCIIQDTEFLGNTGSSLIAEWSTILLIGNVTFSDNIAHSGAALLLDYPKPLQLSFLNLDSSAKVVIANNTALYYGGGIAVNPVCEYGQQCFFHAPYWKDGTCSVSMEGNLALGAGNSMYGPSVENCEPKVTSSSTGNTDFQTLFRIAVGLSANEVVLFKAYSICFCIGDSITNKVQYTQQVKRDVRPGQEIKVLALVCSQPLTETIQNYFIRASLAGPGQLGPMQDLQEVKRPCENLTYSVKAETNVQVMLSYQPISSNQTSFINLTILPCPPGFTLDADLKCDCTEYLLSKIPQVKCNITSNTIHTLGNVWVGIHSSGRLIAHTHYPLDYCIAESHYIDLQEQDQQCTFNRSGILCGRCKADFGLTLGNMRCKDNCLNYYLFLIVPFALAGVLLVFLLLKCKLTVSVGTINALIFYANIIHFNRTAFFPQRKTTFITRFILIFLAWLNLDLGIETLLLQRHDSLH